MKKIPSSGAAGKISGVNADDFSYHRPASLQEALQLLAQPETGTELRPLAGGTDLIPQWREGRRTAAGMLDLKFIPEFTVCEFTPEKGARIGAALPCADLYAQSWLAKNYPALDDAARLIGGWQIQNRASLGGNLCNASPSADGVPALIVDGATAEIIGAAGRRSAPVESFCTGPGRTLLQPGELLLAFMLPVPAARSGSAYLRFTPRAEMDIALCGVAAQLQLDADGKIGSVQIALGAVAPTAIRASEAEKLLLGKKPDEAVFAEAGAAAMATARPISDPRASADYRRHLVGVLTRRALTLASARALSQKKTSS